MSQKYDDKSTKKSKFTILPLRVSTTRTPVKMRGSDPTLRSSSSKKKTCPSTPDTHKKKLKGAGNVFSIHDKTFNDSNICVAVRVRPPSKKEASDDDTSVISVNEDEIVVDGIANENMQPGSCQAFRFDRIFWYSSIKNCLFGNQENIFNEMALPLLDASVEGYNVCLFAYGQTGSGKTYSMIGANGSLCGSEAGIVPRFGNELVKRKLKTPSTEQFSIAISYYEIYNEKIYDLLVGRNENKLQLKVREHPDRGPYVENLSSHSVETSEAFFSWILMGNSRRATAATSHNDRSSRSHSILEFSIIKTSDLKSISSKISLVDLAGSERSSYISGNEERFKESLSINKSLLTLGKVVTALSDTRTGNFVPYRDSVLTWLLRKSLGGDSRTVMLATISPTKSALDESLATLRWANKAQHIICTPLKHEDPRLRLITNLRNEIEQLKHMKENFMKVNPRTDATLMESKIYNEPKKIDIEEHVKILEIQQGKAEEKLKYELEKLEIDFKTSEKMRNELQLQNEILLSGISTQNVTPYHSDYFIHLKHTLETSFSQLSNNENLDEVEEDPPSPFLPIEDSKDVLYHLSQLQSSTSSLQRFIELNKMGDRASVLVNIIQKSLTELTGIVTKQLN